MSQANHIDVHGPNHYPYIVWIENEGEGGGKNVP